MAQTFSLEQNRPDKESALVKQAFLETVGYLTRSLKIVESAVDQWGSLPVLENKKRFINKWLKHVSAFSEEYFSPELSGKRGDS